MATIEEADVKELLQDEDLSITVTPKNRTGYMKEQKIRMMQQIGVAQSALLLQKTPEKEIRTRKGPGGMMLKYVEHAYISETLNFVTLFDWDLIVDKTEEKPDEVVVHGHLIVRLPNGKVVTKYGFGGAKKIAGNQNMSWADVYNSATSKMLKVCAARMGLGLDLYRHEESEEEAVGKPVTISADDTEPATETQRDTLTNMGVKFDDTVTKGQFRRIILEKKGAKK